MHKNLNGLNLKCLWVIIIALSLLMPLFSSEITNKDIPQKGTWDFKMAKQWEIDAVNNEVFGNINTMAESNNGNLYVLDYKRSKVYILDTNGKLVSTFGKKGEGPGEVKEMYTFYLVKGKPEKIAFPDRSRIHFFALDGSYIETKIISENISFRAMIDDNRIISVPYVNWKDPKAKGKFSIFDIKKNKEDLLFEFATFKKGVVIKSSGKNTSMYSYSSSSLTPMMSVYYQPDTHLLYYGMTDNYQLTVRDLSDVPNGGKGKEVIVFSLERDKKEVPKGFKESLLKDIDWPDNIKKDIIAGFPDELTQFIGFRADERGYIYVFHNEPLIKHRQDMDIFSPKGEYLYRASIAVEEGNNISRTYEYRDRLYMVTEDEDGELKLTKYKIVLPQ